MGRALLVLDGPMTKRKAVDWIGRAPIGTRVEFKASKRTLPQNDMLWALLTEVSQQLDHGGRKYDPAEWKAIFLHAFGREVAFLPSLDRKTFLPIELSSSDLSKDEMTDFIEFIMKEAGERGVIFKDHRNSDGAQTPGVSETGDGSPAEAPEEPGDESPSSPGSMIDCAREFLALAQIAWSDPEERDEAFKQCGIDWKAKLPESRHPEIRSVYVTTLAVPTGARNIAQARSFLSETLQCNLEELECKA